MSTRSATTATLPVRRSFQALADWRGHAERAYSPVVSIALLLIVGIAVKIGH